MCVLGAIPAALARLAETDRGRRDELPESRLPAYAAIGAATVALLATLIRSLAGSPIQPVIVVAVTAIVLALVARLAGLFRHEAAASALSREASRQFSELADRTSDAVLVCDRDGTIEYASPAVVHFGYSPGPAHGHLAGRAGPPGGPGQRHPGSAGARATAPQGWRGSPAGCARPTAPGGTWSRRSPGTPSRGRRTGCW